MTGRAAPRLTGRVVTSDADKALRDTLEQPGSAVDRRVATSDGEARPFGEARGRDGMTDEELREWRRREIRCRVEEDAVRAEPLAPPSAFGDAYAPEHPEAEGGRGLESSTVRGLLGGGCCGWDRPPDAAELYAAMRTRRPTPRQLAVAGAFIGEAGIDDLLMAHLEGAFTWRQLAAMIHRLGMETSEFSPYLNRWTDDAGAPPPPDGRTTRVRGGDEAVEGDRRHVEGPPRGAPPHCRRRSRTEPPAAGRSALAGVTERHCTPHETMGLDAARALHEHEYTRVQVYAAENGTIILTLPRHGTPRTTMENDAEVALRDSGIAEYLDANSTVSSYEVEKALHVPGRPAETRLLLDTDDEDPTERIRRCLSPP